ncbi:MAG: thioredoxin domain-containing protein [Phototrophicaceae bacterium]
MNRLQHETSPYLLQHADNPVDWFPWGEEAFEKAKAEDKPILLSVGYSACHWCHVMAHESFEHDPTANIMNEWFINVKVDREERPDVDDIYMQAVQAMNNGQGGWPMTVFMMPDGRPFFGGTYFPREPRHGMPPFRQVMQAVYDAYNNRREELEEQASNLSDALDRTALKLPDDDSGFKISLLNEATKKLKQTFDAQNGGFGSAPKFPNPMNLEYLLRDYERTGDKNTLHTVTFSLKKMAYGGIYDQIGGGFHRYSVDKIWLVPHFEKMLYDNAQLSRLYLHAYQVTGDEFFRVIAEDIYDYVLREMTSPEGGFYSATDADSEGEEGKFFVWSLDELKTALAHIADDVPDAFEVAKAYFDVSADGNFEGTNILNVPIDPEIVAENLELTMDDLQEKLVAIKDRLYAVRTSRVYPSLDDKILTAWNGMMLASLAEASRVLGRDNYLASAERAGDFLLENLQTDEGRLYRTYNRQTAKLNAYLEDYANMIDALLELYQSTFVEKWFVTARKLADTVLEHFTAEDGGFFDTSDDHEKLIVRPRQLQDNATPSGNTMMAKQLIRLSAYTGDARYDEAGRDVLKPLLPAMQTYPQAFGEALNTSDMLIRGLSEVAIVGNPVKAETKALLAQVREVYRPNVITALARDNVDGETTIPLLNYRSMRGDAPTAYVCQNFACKMPVTTAEEMADLLSE